jgi:organic radical activating enzyme
MSMPLLPLINSQPPEKPDYREDGSLDVIDIFDTIQGEGPFSGRPAVFIRLAGCNLQCGGCDTQYTDGRKRMGYGEVYSEAMALSGLASLVVITGGEPLRQNIGELVDELIKRGGVEVQIETNGSLYPNTNSGYLFGPELTIVCCPKTPAVSSRLVPKVDAWKYVIEAGAVDSSDGLPTSVLGEPIRPARPPSHFPREDIYISPVDSGDPVKNKANTEVAVQSCLKFGYRLNLQLHKIVGLP